MFDLEQAQLAHLEFREGPRWTYTEPGTHNRIVSPAFAEREAAEAWRASTIEKQEAARQAAEEAAQRAAEYQAAQAAIAEEEAARRTEAHRLAVSL